MSLIIINTLIKIVLNSFSINTIINSGKKEGIGGIEALFTNATLISNINQYKLLSNVAQLTSRDWDLFLVNPAEANILIDAHPWERDVKTTINKKVLLLDMIPIIIKVICLTLLYAINFLLSLCIIVIRLLIKDNLIQTKNPLILTLIIDNSRDSPYLPNFNRSPARIIEPAVFASTCALGNQKCRPIMGILTVKGAINNIVIKDLISITVFV